MLIQDRPERPRDGYTWGSLRTQVYRRGEAISHRQLHDFEEAGLIKPLDRVTRLWPLTAPDLVVEIIRAGLEIRPLDRRAIRLRRDFTRFPVPAPKLLEHMASFAPRITSPRRKIARLAQVTHQANLKPAPESWAELLQNPPRLADDVLESRIAAQYAYANTLAATASELQIEFEELATMLVIIDLAALRIQRGYGNVLLPGPVEPLPGPPTISQALHGWAEAQASLEHLEAVLKAHASAVHSKYHNNPEQDWRTCPEALCQQAASSLGYAKTIV